MDWYIFGLIDIILPFGAVLAFCVWQIRATRKHLEKYKNAPEAESDAKPEPAARSDRA